MKPTARFASSATKQIASGFDVVKYSKPTSFKDFFLNHRITRGKLIVKNSKFLIIADPITQRYDDKSKKYAPILENKHATFLYIPKGMVIKIIKDKQRGNS